jgi:hypothetical protein
MKPNLLDNAREATDLATPYSLQLWFFTEERGISLRDNAVFIVGGEIVQQQIADWGRNCRHEIIVERRLGPFLHCKRNRRKDDSKTHETSTLRNLLDDLFFFLLGEISAKKRRDVHFFLFEMIYS